MSQSETKTVYGVVVGLVKDEKIFMSRRLDVTRFPKKWQLINGYLQKNEVSKDAAIRLIEAETGLVIEDRDRFHWVQSFTITGFNEMYYIHLVHLKDDESVMSVETKERSVWRAVPISKAQILDMVPALRPHIRKLNVALEHVKSKTLTKTQKIQTYPKDESDLQVYGV